MLWIKDHLLSLVEQYGIVALFLSITLETLGLPLPGESALIATSAAAGAGKFNIWYVAGAAFAAAVLGDNIGYLIGRKFGKTAVLRHGKRIGITHEKYERAEEITAKYGPYMVIGARFFPLLRQLNGLVAGTTGMHWVHFLAANAVGGALWVGLWTTIAYRVGHDVSIVPWIWNHLALVALFVILAVFAILFLLLRRLK